ncbi:MAG: hypothetical protein EPN23_05520 [Verrucomicrobia bacterium]|nr:MAG: hypothetical protein EPN23_05520 [Verrucomicrobiota bacterium]
MFYGIPYPPSSFFRGYFTARRRVDRLAWQTYTSYTKLQLVTLGLRAADNTTATKSPSTPTPPPASVVPNAAGFAIYGQGKSASVAHIGSGWTISTDGHNVRLNATSQGGYTIN